MIYYGSEIESFRSLEGSDVSTWRALLAGAASACRRTDVMNDVRGRNDCGEASGHRTTRLCLPFYLFPWPTNNYSPTPNFITKLRFNKLLRDLILSFKKCSTFLPPNFTN